MSRDQVCPGPSLFEQASAPLLQALPLAVYTLDPDGHVANAYGVALRSTGLPVSVLVARDGTVSSYEPFPLTKDFLDTALAKVL